MSNEQNVTPWTVKVETKGGEKQKINYEKIINQFGCQPLKEEIIAKLEKSSKIKVHHLIKRGMVFAHRDFDKILDAIENNKKFYLYTGRGPSSKSMHLGHAVPFLFCKYLQDAFDVPLVIQITDDEKFLWKNMTLEDATLYGKENIKDIIAFGFDPKKTFIFLNTEYSYKFTKNTLKIGKSISYKEASKVFGFEESYSISQIEFPVKEIVPCYASSFDFLDRDAMCLVPAAIDQDPFFRLARDKAHIISAHKPCTLYSSFLPDINGLDGKMSASEQNSSIFLTDTPDEVKTKITKYAFSGGRDTLKEHREKGANIDIDVAYHYLTFFLEDDKKLENIKNSYKNGSMTTSEVKKECIDVINTFLKQYQEKRNAITHEQYIEFTKFDK